MFDSKLRGAVVACALATVLLALPSTSEGGLFDWLCPSSWSSPPPAAMTYAPPYAVQRISFLPTPVAASVCSPCVPQTSYRWSYSRMPITSYRPVSICDPCTGCLRTVYRPVTRRTLLPWLHRVAYTTHRLNYYSSYSPSYSTTYYPCGVVGSVGAPAVLGCPTGACGPISSGTIISGDGAATVGTDPGYATPSLDTFKTSPTEAAPGTSNQGTQHQDLRPVPSTETNSNPASMNGPVLPRRGDRTAAGRVLQAGHYHPIAWMPPTNTRSGPPLDVSGWRASSD